MRDGIAYYLLLMLVRRLPMLLLALGGSVFALVRWKVHPRASIMTLIALVIYVIEAVLFTVFIYYLPELTSTMRMSSKATGWLYSVIFFFEDFVLAGVILLLVAAAFTGRRTQPDATS